MSEHNRQCGNEPDAKSELQHKQLGYAVAWRNNGKSIHINSGLVLPLEDARIMLAAERLRWSSMENFLVEVMSAEGRSI